MLEPRLGSEHPAGEKAPASLGVVTESESITHRRLGGMCSLV